MSENPFNTQVGGGHYTKCKIQPFEYSFANGLGPAEHTVVKYVTRWRDKGGLKDLEKAKHVIDLLIAFEKGQASAKPEATASEGAQIVKPQAGPGPMFSAYLAVERERQAEWASE